MTDPTRLVYWVIASELCVFLSPRLEFDCDPPYNVEMNKKRWSRICVLASVFVGMPILVGSCLNKRAVEVRRANALLDRVHVEGLSVARDLTWARRALGVAGEKPNMELVKCLSGVGRNCLTQARREVTVKKDFFEAFNVPLDENGKKCSSVGAGSKSPSPCRYKREARLTILCSSNRACEKVAFDVITFVGSEERRSSVVSVSTLMLAKVGPATPSRHTPFQTFWELSRKNRNRESKTARAP